MKEKGEMKFYPPYRFASCTLEKCTYRIPAVKMGDQDLYKRGISKSRR